MARRKSGDGAAGAAPSASSFTEQVAGAREAALRLLTVRERSRAELKLRLRRKGYSVEAVEEVLDRLADSGVQDDRRFAILYAEEAASRGKASRVIQGELRSRGVAVETAASAAVTSPEDEEARAWSLARARAARMAGLAPEVRARRLQGLLARRGYDPELCRRIAAEVGGYADDRP